MGDPPYLWVCCAPMRSFEPACFDKALHISLRNAPSESEFTQCAAFFSSAGIFIGINEPFELLTFYKAFAVAPPNCSRAQD